MPNFIARCTPSLGTVSIWWSRMVESIIWPMGMGKVILYMQDRVGGEIAECRNALVEEALSYDRTCNPISHLFWVDDDVLVFPGSLCELLAQQVECCSGVYCLKLPGPCAQPLLWPDDGTGNAAPRFVPDQVIPAKYHGMGLTLVKTEVYKRMDRELNLPKDRYGKPQWYKTSTADDITMDEDGMIFTGYTEDLFFLNNAAKAGVKPVAVTTKHAFGFHTQSVWTCQCGFQTGDRKVHAAHYREHPDHRVIEDLVGYPEEQWKMWVNHQPIRWQTASGEVVWN